MTHQRLTIEIHGAVQGVGFRPFVFRLAEELGLTGWVLNDSRGVFIEAEGRRELLERFVERLRAERPPRAFIQSLEVGWLAPHGYRSFDIRHSDTAGAKTVLVLPDIATCPDCLAETLNPADRRFGYPFTNCTNCGPRFTIVQNLPYDRPHTTMRDFVLCPACRSEYENPRDRRFHAQPNACPVCGPRLDLWAASPSFAFPGTADESADSCPSPSPIAWAVAALRAGMIVAVKGIGGFHLMVDACDEAAVARLRERKVRREKPFALMVRDVKQAETLCEVGPQAAALLSAPEAPIVLLARRAAARLATSVAPGNPYLGLMLPATPLHHLLLRAMNGPLVATSGNLSDEPICTDEQEAAHRLDGIADMLLVHNRPIARHVDDSVATLLLGQPRLLRRARGYAPLPVLLDREVPCILAVGAHLKNTVALSVARQVFISQHIGDLETVEAIGAFEHVIADFLRLYEATPVVVAHDMHPDYASTRWVQETQRNNQSSIFNLQSSIVIPVQHHHAHLAACLAENNADGPALGVIWDGTGYGLDGTIWGGEFLLGGRADSQRVAHLLPFCLPGGDAAVREPRRTALALLWELYGVEAFEHTDLAPLQSFGEAKLGLLRRMIERRIGTPVTTSAGRLFDGIAALLGLRQQTSFEGQAAMALEWLADPTVDDDYPLDIISSGSLILDWRPLVAAVVEQLRQGVAVPVIAGRVHNTLVAAIVRVVQQLGVAQVALSGGCFQNRLLVERTARRLTDAGFTVLLHRQVPPNDGGISLGQVAAVAAHLTHNP